MTADDLLLQEIEQACQQLLSYLQQEFDALNKQDYQALPGIAQSKQLLVDTLNELDTQVSNKQDLQQHPLWPSARELLQHCQQQNSSNGRLLARSFQISKETLGILTGQGRTSDSIYNASGMQQSSTSALGNVTA